MKAGIWQRGAASVGIGALALTALSLGSVSLAGCGGDDHDDAPVAVTPGPTPAPTPDPTPAPAPAASVVLGGDVDRPATLTLALLEAQPPVVQTDSYLASGQPQTRTYTGALLWSLIDGAGLKVDPARHNDALDFYIVARGSDGYRAVFAAGELMPSFGNRQSLVAYAEGPAGATTPLTTDGPFRVTAPGDLRGGRYVSNLVAVDALRSAATKTATDGAPSTSFEVSGNVTRPGAFDLAALSALPAVTATVGTTTWKGVDLWTFLDSTVGIAADPTAHNPTLSMYLTATGSDGYSAVVSLGEINPGFGNQPALIAYEADGAPIDANGFARLVLPNDVRPGRQVSRLIGLEVLTAQP